MRRLALFAFLGTACGGRPSGGNDESGGTDGESGTSTSGGTGTGTSTETGTEESGEDETCGAFVCESDSMPEVCDPVLQDCPEGEKCTAVGTEPGTCCDTHRCVDVIGDKDLWEPCTRSEDNDDCAPGLFCRTLDQGVTGTGICFGFCPVDDPDGCANTWSIDDAECAPLYGGVVPVCETQCHPLEQDCADGLACMGFVFDWFVCTIPGPGLHADPCDSSLDCASGWLCANASAVDECASESCCTRLCDVSLPNTCPGPNEACVSLWEAGIPPPGYENVGVCAIPG